MTLKEQLDAVAAAASATVPPGTFETLDRAAVERRHSGLIQRALKIGQPAPSFNLPAFGEPFDAARILARGPVILTFFQGTWCPYCTTQLTALEAVRGEIEAAGATLVAVSPQLHGHGEEMVQWRFPILRDAGNRVATDWGLVFKVDGELRELYQRLGVELPHWNGDESWTLPLPATFLLAAGGRIASAHVDPDDRVRAEPETLLGELRALQG